MGRFSTMREPAMREATMAVPSRPATTLSDISGERWIQGSASILAPTKISTADTPSSK